MFFRAKIGYSQLFWNVLPGLQCNIPVIWSKSFSVIFIFNFLPFTPPSTATTSFLSMKYLKACIRNLIETRRMLQPKLFRQVFPEAIWNETGWVYGTKIVIYVIYSLFWLVFERKIVILQTEVKLFNFW